MRRKTELTEDAPQEEVGVFWGFFFGQPVNFEQHIIHRNTRWNRLLYTDKEARREAETAAAPNDCRFFFFLFPRGLSQKNTSHLWICTSTSHDAVSPPTPYQRCAFRTQHPNILISLLCYPQFLCPGFFRQALFWNSCEIHKAQWVTYFLLIVDSRGMIRVFTNN